MMRKDVAQIIAKAKRVHGIAPDADPRALLTQMLHKQEGVVAWLDKTQPGSPLRAAEARHLDLIRRDCAEVGIR